MITRGLGSDWQRTQGMTLRYLLVLLVFATLGSRASAAWIPYYRMDSLAYLSSDIVLCDEVKYVEKGERGRYVYYEATFTVVQTLKGSCLPKEKLTVVVDLVYTRRVLRFLGEPRDKPPEIPLGRVLLFLTKDQDAWRPVSGGVKMIFKGETYTYGQFVSNPGSLYLARMAPENIDVPETTPYDEKLLLKDLEVAQEKAKLLTRAIGETATDAVVRKDLRPK